MIEYLAIYLAIGVAVAGFAGQTEGPIMGTICGFLWPVFFLIVLFSFMVSRR